jgi:hypothetical protein
MRVALDAIFFATSFFVTFLSGTEVFFTTFFVTFLGVVEWLVELDPSLPS